MNVRVTVRVLGALMALFVLAGALLGTANAQDQGRTFSVSPALLLANIPPGGTHTYAVTVKAKDAMTFDVGADGMGQTEDGGFLTLEGPADASPFSARTYISATPSKFSLAANTSKDVNVTIAVPPDAGDGGRYAVLSIRGVSGQAGQANVGVGGSIGASVIVTLEGRTRTMTGEITDMNIASFDARKPIHVTTRLKNTGNYHYGGVSQRMYAGATLLDPKGNTIAVSTTPYTDSSVVPTFSRDFAIDVSPGSKLVAGKYTMQVEVGLENGTVLDTKSKDFTLSQSEVLGAARGGSSNTWQYIAGGAGGGSVLALVLLLAVMRRRRQRRQLSPAG